MSAEMKIIDKDGQWLINRSEFRMVSPDGKIMESATPTKIIVTEWHMNQPVIESVGDPTDDSGAEVAPKAMKAAKVERLEIPSMSLSGKK